MNQEEITKIYETLAPMAGDYMNAQAEQIGQAQRSMGTLAGRTQGATTSGLGNYTYNRLMRPQVQTMRDEIRVQGYANQLNRLLSDALNNARNNYNKSSNSSNNSNSTQQSTWNGEIEKEEINSKNVSKQGTGDFELMWVISPNGDRTQWKRNDGFLGYSGYDTPESSYEFIAGTKKLKDLANRGYIITDENGNDITSRYK